VTLSREDALEGVQVRLLVVDDEDGAPAIHGETIALWRPIHSPNRGSTNSCASNSFRSATFSRTPTSRTGIIIVSQIRKITPPFPVRYSLENTKPVTPSTSWYRRAQWLELCPLVAS